MPSTCEVLDQAQELIRDPDHWTQGTYGRNAQGDPCAASDADACQFCAIGAMHRVTGVDRDPSIDPATFQNAISLLKIAALEFGRKGPTSVVQLTDINDRMGHDAVMQLYDKARDLCHKEDKV